MKVRIPNQGGGMGNMQNLMKQAQKMQEDMQTLQADLDEREYTVSAGGGMVNVTINGKKTITAIKINPEIVDPDDVETLEDIVMAGVNEAIGKVEATQAEEMGKITGPMGLGGGFPGLM